MKKHFLLLSIILSVAILFVAILSCTDESLSNSNQSIPSDFNDFLYTQSQELNDHYLKDLIIENPKNPYDSVGIKHNVILTEIYSDSNLNKTLTEVMEIFKNDYGVIFLQPESYYAELMESTIERVYFQDGSYNPEYINSTDSATSTEKQIINDYFETMKETPELEKRIVLTKESESFILNSQLSNDVKRRILITFTLYRHSTYFWSRFENKSNVIDADLLDAIALYAAFNCDGEYAENFQDGKDCYLFASSFSVAASIILL
ncbi:MAG: hypothetical protein ACQES0_00355 [Bacteroidota bacterium]